MDVFEIFRNNHEVYMNQIARIQRNGEEKKEMASSKTLLAVK